MLKNYFLIAYRNLLKYKGFASVNIFGLAGGFSVCLLLGSYIQAECNINHDLRNGERGSTSLKANGMKPDWVRL